MRLSRLLVTSLLGSAGIAPAQPAGHESARWVSRWDHGECQLIRAVGDEERVGIRATIAGDLTLWVFRRGGARYGIMRRGADVLIVTPPAAEPLTGNLVGRSRDGSDMVYQIALPAEVLDALAAATAVQVDIDGVRIIDLPLRNAAAAIDVLRQCMNDQRQEVEGQSGR